MTVVISQKLVKGNKIRREETQYDFPNYPIGRSLILLEPQGKMNRVIAYDAV